MVTDSLFAAAPEVYQLPIFIESVAMSTIDQVAQFLNEFAPTRLAEEWDNVGLLVGDRSASAAKIMTCLTVTPESAQEAIDDNANLIVAHHPLPFRPIKRITTDSVATKMIWDLIRAGVSIYSPHTGFDSASVGINQSLAERLGLNQVVPINPIADDPQQLGAGRIGKRATPVSLESFANEIKNDFGIKTLQVVGQPEAQIKKVALACGSGGSFLSAAIRAGCDTFVTGETTFHTALEAKANSVSLVLLGHYFSERFAVESLAVTLADQFKDSIVWASKDETDPLSWM
jgi:dinuclear metal center YbgI/SA1388 family protein